MPQLPNELRSAALQFLNDDENAWWVRDFTGSFGRFDFERLFWIIDSDDKSVMVVLAANGDAAPLTGPAGLPLSGELLKNAFGSQPWKILGVERFANTILSWHGDPRLYILSGDFFKKQQPVIRSWLTKREKNPDTLKAACRAAEFSIVFNRWRLEVNAINRRGGVERWIMGGRVDEFTIDEVSGAPIHADGAFNFPDEL